ncbi:XrtA-associated tyrosine autokinase [Gayadomonas joobiniege]|uniref:XrtA-associated tyrosine autokinase n=1 Tax=Gayadomonas joobiniege TaxID=1234606 RepID=UPI00037CA78A|nr:XrtA-associated tyrosine autokinase [Gayadomonas joobiniege]
MSTIEKALAKQGQTKKEAQVARQSDGETSTSVTSRTASTRQGKTVELPIEQLAEQGYVTPGADRIIINEEMRAIKRKLLSNAFGPISKTITDANLIAVTSSVPQEGKSFTAINLAFSIAAEQDKTVLLVDGDVLKPSLTKKLQLEGQVDEGLMEYLLAETDQVSDIIYSTNVANLKFIPAGKHNHLATELLSSERMKKLADEFARRYPDRIVVIDAPPILGINETIVVTHFAGQILVVVEEESTNLNDLKKAVDHLDKEKAIGFVINKSKSNKEASYGYGYGYAYANGHKA